MDQIYYTQCPMGYGLGASNGFQIKRKSTNYPLTGDFRHLGMKAFLPTGRTLAPVVLRYRREDGVIEIARLTPRAFEYETERGLWGRPGGVFSHGLRLSSQEARHIADFPAGLIDAPFWKLADPVPSLGNEPEAIALTAVEPTRPPITTELAAQLPALLTAVARVASEGRTLFLIDEPARLAQAVALLTFAFPPELRRHLSFSTYHERPEELPGYRISGTTATARPNRPALLSQGIIADLTTSIMEPAVAPAHWAQTLADWLIRWDESDRLAWQATARRVAKLAAVDWSAQGLGALVALEAMRSSRPDRPAAWDQLAAIARWGKAVGLGAECVSARDVAWWLNAEDTHCAEARGAFLAHAQLAESWQSTDAAAAWGRGLVAWYRESTDTERVAALREIAQFAPNDDRTAFVASSIAHMTTQQADFALQTLRAEPTFDRASLFPLEVRGALERLVTKGQKQEMKMLLSEAMAHRGVLRLVLDEIESKVQMQPASWSSFAPFVPAIIDSAVKRKQYDVEWWALRQTDPARWLSPSLRRVFAEPDNQEVWQKLRDRTPRELRPRLAQIVLGVTIDPNLPGDGQAFRWSVENLLLPLEIPNRPQDRTWASAYLEINTSDYQLVKVFRGVGEPGADSVIRVWLKESQLRGELKGDQIERLENLDAVARLDQASRSQAFRAIKLAAIPAADRGAFLNDWLQIRWGEDLGAVLHAIGQAWSDSLRPLRPELRSIAKAISHPLRDATVEASRWVERLDRSLDHLGVDATERWHPGGLASAIIAETLLPLNFHDTNRLASEILNHDLTWRALFLHARDDQAPLPPAMAVRGFARWEKDYEKRNHASRYAEIYLNACDGVRLAAIVAAFGDVLHKLDPLPWWDHASQSEAKDDIRDAFARLAPMAPLLPIDKDFPIKRRSVHQWIRRAPRQNEANRDPDEIALKPLDVSSRSSVAPLSAESVNLSPIGIARWRLIDELTRYEEAADGVLRQQITGDWRSASLPFAQVADADRYRFVAWVIRGAVGDAIMVESFAKWVVNAVGCRDADRLRRWSDEICGVIAVGPEVIGARSKLVDELVLEVKRVLRGE